MRLRTLVTLIVVSAFAHAQPSPPNQTGNGTPVTTNQISMPVLATNPTSAVNATLAVVGNPGPRTDYYWIVANYLVGSATPAGPFQITTAPNTRSSSNYVTVNPTFSGAGVLNYDVLRTTRPIAPTGACACAVATAVAVGTVTNDQSGSLSAYTVNPINIATLDLTLQNEVQSAGASHLILRQNGQLVCDLSTGCGGGGGEIGGSGTNGTIPLFTPNGTTLGNSLLTQSGTSVSLGTISETAFDSLAVYGPTTLVASANDTGRTCGSTCYGLLLEPGYTGAGLGSGATLGGADIVVSHNATGMTNTVFGSSIIANNNAGTVTTLFGLDVIAEGGSSGSGSETTQYGARIRSFDFGNASSFNIGTNIDLDLTSGAFSGSGTAGIANDYTAYIEPLPAGGGSLVTNHSGIYIADQGPQNFANSTWFALNIQPQSVGPGFLKPTVAMNMGGVYHYSGTGVPTFNCGSGSTPSVYWRSDATTVSTLEYLCISGTAWVAVAAP